KAVLDLSNAAFAQLASEINGLGTGQTLDLTNATALSALISNVAQSQSIILQAGDADKIAAVIAASNAALAALQVNAGATLVDEVTALERIAQGATSNALKQAAGSPTALAVVDGEYEGTNLSNAAATAQQGVLDQVQAFADVTSLATVTGVTPS